MTAQSREGTTTPQVKKTFCTICTAFCGFEATVENGRVLDMVPDTSHPMSQGFSCTKGRQFHHLLTAPDRMTFAMRRQTGGDLERATPESVLDEIAAQLSRIRAEHGPDSVALYCGNGATFKTTLMPAAHAWIKGTESHQIYSSLTIDQPAKVIAAGRVGVWAGGVHDFESAEVAILIGNNVVVSSLHVPGAAPGWRPRAIREAKERGLQLIVVDPRRTQTANLADLHLQIRPGEDATLLAGMIKLILESGRYDEAFCAEFADGVEELSSAVEPFDLDYVAQRTGLAPEDILRTVDLYTSAARGTVSSATGPDMGPHGNIAEHLISALNVLCGRVNRAGEIHENVGMLMADLPSVAAVVPRAFMPPSINPDANTRRSRIHGAHQLFQEMPTGTLADEILSPGDGQIRALVVIGGNPLTSWPDQDKTRRALESLDLLVCIDVRRSATVELADYFLPASYGLERPELNAYNDFLYNKPFVQFAEPVVNAPDDAREEWIYLAELAKRMGTPMQLHGEPLDLENLPAPSDFFSLLYPEGSTRVPLEDLTRHEGGKVHEQFERIEVQPKFEGMDDRFQLFPDGVAEEFQVLLARDPGTEGRFGPDGQYTHLLTNRRNGKVYNSMCHELPRTANSNPAHLHPLDIQAIGAEDGQVVRLVSEHGAIDAQLAEDPTMRRGVVAVTHGFGGSARREQGGRFAAVSRLLSTETTLDRITHMPIMSAVPVRFELIDELLVGDPAG